MEMKQSIQRKFVWEICMFVITRFRFVFPLNNAGVLCEVEVTVGVDKKVGSEVDLEGLKRILEHKDTHPTTNDEFHAIKVGEVPSKAEVVVKCTYVTIATIVGMYFLLLLCLL
jgi:hypothetical protein